MNNQPQIKTSNSTHITENSKVRFLPNHNREALNQKTRKIQIVSPRDTGRDPDVYLEDHKTSCSFNVMPDRPVSETLTVKEYSIHDRYAEAILDREYFSAMEKSPSHLIFLTGLVHTQKLLYMTLCREFGIEYRATDSEKLKVWPTQVSVDMPRMIRAESDILQRLTIERIFQKAEKQFIVDLRSDFDRAVTIKSRSAVFLI